MSNWPTYRLYTNPDPPPAVNSAGLSFRGDVSRPEHESIHILESQRAIEFWLAANHVLLDISKFNSGLWNLPAGTSWVGKQLHLKLHLILHSWEGILRVLCVLSISSDSQSPPAFSFSIYMNNVSTFISLQHVFQAKPQKYAASDLKTTRVGICLDVACNEKLEAATHTQISNLFA